MPDHQQAAIEAGARAYDPEAWTAYDRESPSTEGRELMVEYSKSKAESILAAAEPHLRRKWAEEIREKVNPPDVDYSHEWRRGFTVGAIKAARFVEGVDND